MRVGRLLGALAFAATAAAAEPPPNAALHALFEREFRSHLEEFPVLATILGVEGYDDRLPDFSPRAIAQRKARNARLAGELERFDPATLSTQDRISREVMLAGARLTQGENAFYGDLPFGAGFDGWLPASPMFGMHTMAASMAKATRFRTVRDYESYLKRLEAFPRMLAQQVERMRAGMRSGWMPPAEAMQRVPGMYDVYAGVDVTATPLWRPFEDFPADIPAAQQARLAAAGRDVLEKRVHPAFASLQRFLATEYVPAARKELAASALPAGSAFYEHRLREHTTTPMGAREIHELGKREVARIREAMDATIAATGFKGSFAEFVRFLQTDERFFFKRPEDRLRAYRDIAKRADAELPRLFAVLPRTPYGVRAMEAYEGDNADRYTQPAADGSRAGFFEANVNNLGKRPSSEMEAVLLHEAVPGHHLQAARAQELEGLPMFRRTGFHTAYGEGWALYAESLGYEMGFYKDPYSRFGALSAEMHRACRMVVDTGLHAFGWSRQRSIDYLVDNAGITRDFAAAEVDRYIVWPGQAVAYKVGELRIKALRARAREALGERFDLRRFHNAVLDDGPLPLGVLEARIDEWIAAQRAAADPAGGKP